MNQQIGLCQVTNSEQVYILRNSNFLADVMF
jgi:hypothetical protein